MSIFQIRAFWRHMRRENCSELLKSATVRYYLMAHTVGVIAVMLSIRGTQFHSWANALRYAAFQVISIGTSTGFTTIDSSLWPPFTQLVMIFFTLQCACAGSTSGGIKVDRIVLFWKAIVKKIKKMQHPAAVIKIKMDTVAVEGDVVEVDILSDFSGSAATMGNVGPGFGVVGSMSNFSQIPAFGKRVLTATMLLGRLEIFGLILFFSAKSWG
jgi:trk system potassium uptake protein TrkH